MLINCPEDGIPKLCNTKISIDNAVNRLAQGTGLLAMDTERAGQFICDERACLIQVRRTGVGTVLFDALRHPEAIRNAAQVFNSTGWILHSASDDLPCLLQLGLRPLHLEDTMLAGKLIGLPRPGLNPMLEHFLSISLAKGKGQEDWSQRPLPDDMLAYAALDVEFLAELLEESLATLDELGRTEWYRQECAHALATAQPLRTMEFTDLKGLHRLRGVKELALAYQLNYTRVELARDYDVPLINILPHAAVIDIARAPQPMRLLGSELRRNHRRNAGLDLSPLFDAVADVLKSPPSRWKKLDLAGMVAANQPRTPIVPSITRWKEESPRTLRRYEQWRDRLEDVAEELNLKVETLVTLRSIKGLAWHLDKAAPDNSPKDYLTSWGVRPWQMSIILEALNL